jgi:hypothetical protein
LHISDDVVRVIQFGQGKHNLEVLKYGERPIAVGIVEAGYIKDGKVLSKTISELVSGLGISFVRASIPEEKTYLFKMELTTLDERQIRQNIEFKLEENVPLNPSEALFYFDILPGSKAGKHYAMVSVVPRKVIDTYLGVLADAGLTVFSFEIEPRSLARALASQKTSGTVLIVDIMKNKTGMYVVCDGVASFTSTITLGESMLTSGNIETSAEELRREINKVYSYWIDHGEGSGTINKILLCGKGALHVSHISHMSPDPAVPVEIANIWLNAFSSDRYIPPISRDQSLDYAVAAGLALPQ